MDRTERVLRTLERSDSEFRRLVGVLYGPDADAGEVYGDVFAKAMPDQADVHVPGALSPDAQRRKREQLEARVGLATNAGAITAGTAAFGMASRKPELTQGGPVARGLYRFGRLVPSPIANRVERLPEPLRNKRAAQLAVGAAGLQAVDVAGDFVARRVLHRAKQNDPTVAKATVPVGQLADATAKIKTALVPAEHPAVQSFMERLKDAQTARSAATPTAAKPARAGATNLRAAGPPSDAGVPGSTPIPRKPDPKAVPAVGNPAAPDVGNSAAVNLGNAAGSLYNAATSSTGAKLATAGIGAAGVLALRRRNATANNGQPVDPYTLYGKRDEPSSVVWSGTFSKFDEDKHLAFGWASVTKIDGLPVVDRQGDYIADDDLEEAAYRYVMESRKGGHMHRRDEFDQPVAVSDLVESVVFTPEKIAKMGLPDTTPCGWWIGTKIHDPEVWSEVKKGNLGGFSIHGRGRRVERDYDSVMTS